MLKPSLFLLNLAHPTPNPTPYGPHTQMLMRPSLIFGTASPKLVASHSYPAEIHTHAE